MEEIQVQNKFKILFTKILEPNYVMNNYYVDSLINKLSNDADPEILALKKTALLSDFMIETLSHTNNGTHSTVKVFILRCLAICAQEELYFVKMLSRHQETLAIGFKNISTPAVNSSLRVAYMELALGIIKHNSGVSWLLENGAWKEILSLCYEKHTVFVDRLTYKFITKFLWKLSELEDETNLRLVINTILSPVQGSEMLNKLCHTTDDVAELIKPIQPILNIMLAVVSEDGQIKRPNLLMNILINECNITGTLHLMLISLRSPDISLLIAKILFYLSLAKIFIVKPIHPPVLYTKADFVEVCALYHNHIQMYIQRRLPTAALDYCYNTILIWSSIWKNNPDLDSESAKGTKTNNQFLFMPLVPCLVFVKERMGNLNNRCAMSDERINELISTFLSSDCELTARTAYALRDLIQESDMLSVTLQSVKRVSSLKNHLNNEQANLIFRVLFYVLKEYVPHEDGDSQPEENMEDSQEKVQVITYVLDTVLCLVTNYDINWTKSLEILCLYWTMHSILQRRNLSCKFVVAALNLIIVLVRKFLTPNLCLLLESTPGSPIHDIGQLIYLKLHDMNWEIRDSALELLLVCTEVSYIKFTPFQKQIQEKNLITVAAAIAFNDFEPYVQTSALKCIGAASKVHILWEQLNEAYPNIHEMLIAVLNGHSEGLVRKEACNVLCELYQNIKLNYFFKTSLYEHMVAAAVSDFHWEVQLSALKFWKTAIHSFLTDQGMLDGNFPPVTFSRETRKIVNLNEKEIRIRMIKILEDLSASGCLTVLVKLLHEDTEVDILEQTLSISMEFYNLLTKYKVPEIIKPNPEDITNVDEIDYEIKHELHLDKQMDVEQEGDNCEKVIDGIINSDDVNLLANIYENQLRLDRQPETVKIKLYRYAPPSLFISHLKSKDFKEIIEHKRKWSLGIRSVSSLLDDVLGIYEINHEANSLDCY